METEHDLKLELLTINTINRLWNCESVKLPNHQRLDFALLQRGEIKAFVEIKCRTFESSRYKETMLHLDMVMAARDLTFHTNIPAFLVVRWTDVIGFVNFNADFRTEIGGRVDRGLERDFGLMAKIAIMDFSMLEAVK